MNLWGFLASAISAATDIFDSDSSSGRETRSRESNVTSRRRDKYAGGDVLSGKVEFVGKTFAKVVSGELTAVVFPPEMADGFVSDPTEVLSAGQDTDFVLLMKDSHGWKASIRAVSEARTRQALDRLRPGQLVTGRVLELKNRGVVVNVGELEVWIPATELAWHWIHHPSDVVSLGDEVEAKITRVEAPAGWLEDRRNRRARAMASLRACISKPESRAVPVAFSGMPFKIWAVAKTPRECDQVTLFVLEELVFGQSVEEISAITGLNHNTLEDIHALLHEQSFVKSWRPTERGKKLVEAVALARELNDDPIRGLFVSAAHPQNQLISSHDHSQQKAYPRGWPRPPFNKPVEDDFAKATDEALPEPLLEKLVPEDKRNVLARLQEDSRLRVFIRRDGGRPWKSVFVECREDWLLAGLWSAFTPVFGNPFRPRPDSVRCQNFLMVRCHLTYESTKGEPQKVVYFEPFTASLWSLNEGVKVRVWESRGDTFPALPTFDSESLDPDSEKLPWNLEVDTWCRVKVF